MARDLRALWPAAVLALGLWLCTAVLSGLSGNSGSPAIRLIGSLLPPTVPSRLWQWSPVWAGLVVGFVGLTLAITWLALARPSRQFLALWFAAVVAGVVASVPWSLGMIIASYPPPRASFLLSAAGDSLVLSAFWGVVFGWIPALVAAGTLRGPDASAPPPPTQRRLAWLLPVALVLTLVASTAVVVAGARDARAASLAEQAQAGENPVPEPGVVVTPPAAIAPDAPRRRPRLVHPRAVDAAAR